MDQVKMIRARKQAQQVLDRHLTEAQGLLQFAFRHQLVLKRHLLASVQSPLRKQLLEQQWNVRNRRLSRAAQRPLTVADVALVAASLSWMNHLVRDFDPNQALPQDVMQEIVDNAVTLLR